MDKHESALSYAAAGWKVFPCSANSKIPLAGTHGVKDATSDIDVINEWWSRNPDANIGLACGSASGVYVVDVDVRPDKGVDGFESIRQSGKTLPPTRSQNTPSGGRHYLFKCTGERPANKNGFLLGVDVRGDGYYIVVAPSVINGKYYEWNDDCTNLAEFPDDFKASKVVQSPILSFPSHVSSSGSMRDRAIAYLAKIPGAIEHMDGHAKLFWVAQVLINGFRLSDAEAEDLMWNEFNPRCSPPWERCARTEKEFRHKIKEAHSKPNAEACAIFEARQEDDFDLDACIADVAGMLTPKKPKPSPSVVLDDEFTNELLVPDGLVGDIAQWMNDTAGCYQPRFSLGASLSLCGALFGRKVCDESDGRTNIYCMGVGHSSSGKDHPGNCIAKILSAAGADKLLMGRMTSDAAIEKVLSVSPVKLAVLDEVGHFFSTINQSGSGSTYLKTIKPTLMELFSSAHKTYIGKEKAEGTTKTIIQPCMCIWGVTAPQKLFDGMTIEELQDGWIARNLIFISETRPQYVMKPMAEVPDNIAATVKAWFFRGSDMIITADPGGMPKPLIVRMDEKAKAIFERFATEAHDAMLQANKSGDKTEYLWGKAFQNARRIALIIACGKEYEGPVIGEYEANYGCRLVRALVRNTAKAIAANVSENKWEAAKARIRKIVEDAGRNGISKTELTRRTQWIKDHKERDEYIKDLTTANVIRLVEVTNIIGRKRSVYVLTPIAEQLEGETGIEHIEVE